MRLALPLLLVAATAHADPDPCSAANLHLTHVRPLAPVVVGPTCHIRTADGMIARDRLRTTFPSIDDEPGSGQLTLTITSARQLAAAVTCDGPLPTIDFTRHHAQVIVRDHLRSGHAQLAATYDDGHTLVLADRVVNGCPGGARYTFDRILDTTIVVVPTDRTVIRRTCGAVAPTPCRTGLK